MMQQAVATPSVREGEGTMANPDWVYDWAFEHFTGKLRERIQQGWRVLSISQYGEGQDTRFAGLFVNRPGPRLDWVLGWARRDFEWACAEKAKAGLFPILVTGNGGGPNANFSAVFEERSQSQGTEISVGVDLAAYPQEVKDRAKGQWIARSAALHDDSANATAVTTVWDRNTGEVGWNAFAGLSHEEFETYFKEQHRVWGRPTFVTGSTRGRRLAIYRDDQIGQIGTGFVLRPAMTGEDWQAERVKLLEQGIYPVCLQGHGTGEGRRFAAIFQRGEAPAARVVRRRGSAGVAAIDDAVTDLMKASSIRAAALAIVDGTKLVYARSYSRAEPDYPVVEPTTVFRLASVSKLPIALAIHQAVAEKLLRLGDGLPQAIPLTNPDGSAPTNTAYLNGTVQSLLEYGGWFERYEGRYEDAARAMGVDLPLSYRPDRALHADRAATRHSERPAGRFRLFPGGPDRPPAAQQERGRGGAPGSAPDASGPEAAARRAVPDLPSGGGRGALPPARPRHGPQPDVEEPADRAARLWRRAFRDARGLGRAVRVGRRRRADPRGDECEALHTARPAGGREPPHARRGTGAGPRLRLARDRRRQAARAQGRQAADLAVRDLLRGGRAVQRGRLERPAHRPEPLGRGARRRQWLVPALRPRAERGRRRALAPAGPVPGLRHGVAASDPGGLALVCQVRGDVLRRPWRRRLLEGWRP